MDWWTGGLVGWWTGGLVDWWTGGLVDWWTGGLVDWWTGRLVLVDWRTRGLDIKHGLRIKDILSAKCGPSLKVAVRKMHKIAI